MKQLLLASVIGLTALAATAGTSSAALSMKESKYCQMNIYDNLCMTPEMMKMREAMMAMTKEKAMANRSKYCEEHATDKDPVCTPEMMKDTTGY